MLEQNLLSLSQKNMSKMISILKPLVNYRKKINLLLLLFFSVVVTYSFSTNVVYGGGVAEGCSMYEISSECDLSGWMHLVLDSAQAGALALFLHFLAHRQTKKLELIITNQENKRTKKEKFANETLKNNFTVLLFVISLLNRSINEHNDNPEEREKKKSSISDETNRLENIKINIQYTALTCSDVLAPEALTEIQQIQRLIENPIKSENGYYFFDKYGEIKEKVTKASSLLK